jgi:hypothetical protein
MYFSKESHVKNPHCLFLKPETSLVTRYTVNIDTAVALVLSQDSALIANIYQDITSSPLKEYR